MLILDLLLLIAAFLLAGNDFGKVLRDEAGWKTGVIATIDFLVGLYFTLALIGTSANLALLSVSQ